MSVERRGRLARASENGILAKIPGNGLADIGRAVKLRLTLYEYAPGPASGDYCEEHGQNETAGKHDHHERTAGVSAPPKRRGFQAPRRGSAGDWSFVV